MKFPKKILITGSSGFVGSNLCDLAKKKGFEVHTLDIKKNNGIIGDIRTINWKEVNLKNMDAVVHLAAKISVIESINDSKTYNEVNVKATERLFQACRDAKVRKIIFASSAAVYGKSQNKIKVVGEEGRLASPYALTKMKGEEIANKLETNDSNFISIRLFNIYGPGQEVKGPYSSAIPLFIHKILNGDIIKIYGDGNQTRDFIHVKDVCSTILSLIDSEIKLSKTINLGSGNGISINKLLRIIIKIFENEGIDIPNINYENERIGDVRHSIADVNELIEYVDLNDFVKIEDGLYNLVTGKK